MKDNPATARKRLKRWRRLNLKRHRKVSAAWKERNPTWYIGPAKIRLLTQAIIMDNVKSKIWRDAGMTLDEWVTPSLHTLHTSLQDGWKLKPIRGWRKWDLTSPLQLRLFLHPDNFTLIRK